MFSARNSIITIRSVRSGPFSYWENGECRHHASLPKEGDIIVSISGEVASDDVRKLMPAPFPCGPGYLL